MIDAIPLADTSVKSLVFQTVATARKRGWNAAIVGAAGVGKTRAITAYAESHPKTGLLTATDALGRSPRDLWLSISNELIGTAGGSTADIQDELFTYNLADVVLILDEAQNLPPVQLREILHLNDQTRLTIVYSGNWEVLKRAKARQGAWDQIVSRIALFETIDGILEEDVDALAAAFDVTDTQTLPILRRIGKQHHARGVARVLEVARDHASGNQIRSSHVRNALSFFPHYRSLLT